MPQDAPASKLYRTKDGWLLLAGGQVTRLPDGAAAGLTTRDDLPEFLAALRERGEAADVPSELLPPIDRQEVWAAGVTYFRSRSARMDESRKAGAADFYDRVYSADRPELFFKALPFRVVGHGGAVKIRRDSSWNVPEPELAILISPGGRIVGYTIGNDMSSRDIEGENPLYLPQAKVYDRSCALGPGILVSPGPLAPSTGIALDIRRHGMRVFSGSTTLTQIKRELPVLVEYLFRESSFPDGCVLLTGTGIVPPDSFTLAAGDDIRITIDGIGTLGNYVG